MAPPSDLVEPEPQTEDVSEGKHAAADADAVFVGGVQMDEYGEFVPEDDAGDFFGQHAYDTDEQESEVVGLTDEAKRLLEVAREEMAA